MSLNSREYSQGTLLSLKLNLVVFQCSFGGEKFLVAASLTFLVPESFL